LLRASIRKRRRQILRSSKRDYIPGRIREEKGLLMGDQFFKKKSGFREVTRGSRVIDAARRRKPSYTKRRRNQEKRGSKVASLGGPIGCQLETCSGRSSKRELGKDIVVQVANVSNCGGPMEVWVQNGRTGGSRGVWGMQDTLCYQASNRRT